MSGVFSRRFIAQNKVASYVICDLSRSCLPRLMVPISSRHATRNPRLETSARSLSAQRQAAAAPARRSTFLGLARSALVWVATSVGVRSTPAPCWFGRRNDSETTGDSSAKAASLVVRRSLKKSANSSRTCGDLIRLGDRLVSWESSVSSVSP